MILWCTCVFSIQDKTKFVFDEVCSIIRILASQHTIACYILMLQYITLGLSAI
jgi:hypothetical protein